MLRGRMVGVGEQGSSSPQEGGMWELVITLLPLGYTLLIYSLSGIRM